MFISIFVAVSVMYYYIFDTIRTPKYQESVRVFIAATYVDTSKLEDKLFYDFETSPIKEIKVDYSDQNASSFNTVFQTRGLVNTDILILPSDIVPSGQYSRYFARLDRTVLASYLIGVTLDYYIDDDQLDYGIRVSRAALDFIEGKESDEYFVFLNKNSGKISPLNIQSTNDGALVAVKNLYMETNI